ncbi:glycosyltransferase family 39 protein [Defluviimonas sp. D31]|uniref:glycosyltransferase family 39 protein n=1 Tax=Defluviimonas sp. D31 TaxID=3083253 RepID=UPI00296E77BC|nr:glycosyltransferase family 39 protein [Defluviimonas sp. D31]MDW4549858.1 glycosyltransferase family 39 protein [Defluviimonas sp. D31]
MDRISRSDWFWLGAILALATALRVRGLNGPLWYDELQTVVTHLRLSWGDMLQSYSMNHHYLHNIAAKVSMEAFGESSWAIRLPAMVFGLASLAAMWALAREVAGSAIAHVTTLLLALSYHEIWFSQNARGYTGLALFSTLGMLLFLRGIARPTVAIWLGYGLCLAAAVFTHLTGAFFFAAQGLVWLALVATHALRGRLDGALLRLPFLGFLAGGLLATLLYLPILPSLLVTVSTVSETSAVDVMKEYQNPIWTAFEAIRTGIGHAGPFTALVGAAVLILSALGAVALHHDAPLFAPITLLHIILTTALLMAVGMRIWPRFFFVDIGFLMLLIVMGVRLSCDLVGHLIKNERAGRGLFALAVVAMAAISLLLAKRNYEIPKQDLAGAFEIVEEIARPGERVFAVGHAGAVYRDYFHAGWPIIYTEDDYRAATAEPGPLILVVGFPGRNFREVPGLGHDAGPDPCDEKRAAGHLLTAVACLPGTLGDGDVIVLRRD